MFNFEFTKEGYIQARKYLKSLDRWEEVSKKLPDEAISLANEISWETTNKN